MHAAIYVTSYSWRKLVVQLANSNCMYSKIIHPFKTLCVRCTCSVGCRRVFVTGCTGERCSYFEVLCLRPCCHLETTAGKSASLS